jgi:hypothetical protein
MGRDRPEDIVAFLEDNKDIPSRFENPSAASAGVETPLKKPREQFPVLPYTRQEHLNLPVLSQREFPYSFDVYRAAEAWYNYAQEPLPDPRPREEAFGPVPYDKVHFRLPKMATIIFRSYPARVAFYIAENLGFGSLGDDGEGWFDSHDGWTIEGWFPSGPVTVGTELKYRSGPAWHTAYAKYLQLGKDNDLYFSNQEIIELFEMDQKSMPLMKKYLEKVGKFPGRMDQVPSELRASFQTKKRMDHRDYQRNLINYEAYLNQARVELEDETVAVRKLFFRAKRKAAQFAQPEAIAVYEEALPRWLEILLANPGFRHIPEIQSETYELEMRHLRLRQRQPAERRRLKDTILGVMQFGMVHPNVPLGAGFPVLQLKEGEEKSLLPLKLFQGPLESIFLMEFRDAIHDSLKDFLLTLGEGAQQPPILRTPFAENRVFVIQGPPDANAKSQGSMGTWRPLIGEAAIREIRQLHGLNVASQPPPGFPGKGPPR